MEIYLIFGFYEEIFILIVMIIHILGDLPYSVLRQPSNTIFPIFDKEKVVKILEKVLVPIVS